MAPTTPGSQNPLRIPNLPAGGLSTDLPGPQAQAPLPSSHFAKPKQATCSMFFVPLALHGPILRCASLDLLFLTHFIYLLTDLGENHRIETAFYKPAQHTALSYILPHYERKVLYLHLLFKYGHCYAPRHCTVSFNSLS